MTTALASAFTAAELPIGRCVALATKDGGILGANGTTTVRSVDGDIVDLQVGKFGNRQVRLSSIVSLTIFAETSAPLGVR